MARIVAIIGMVVILTPLIFISWDYWHQVACSLEVISNHCEPRIIDWNKIKMKSDLIDLALAIRGETPMAFRLHDGGQN